MVTGVAAVVGVAGRGRRRCGVAEGSFATSTDSTVHRGLVVEARAPARVCAVRESVVWSASKRHGRRFRFLYYIGIICPEP